jgi:hypothetical protein
LTFWSSAAAAAAEPTWLVVVVQVELTKKEITLSQLARQSLLKLGPEEEAPTGVRAFMEPMADRQNLETSLFLVAVEAHLGTGLIQMAQAVPTVQLLHQ